MYKYNNNRNNDIGTWNRNEPTICGVTRSDSKTTDRNTALAKTNETTDSVEINKPQELSNKNNAYTGKK